VLLEVVLAGGIVVAAVSTSGAVGIGF